MVFVKSRLLKMIRSIKMTLYLDLASQLFTEFAFKAVDDPFSPDQSSSGELGELHSHAEFIRDEHLVLFIDQQAVDTDIENGHTFT